MDKKYFNETDIKFKNSLYRKNPFSMKDSFLLIREKWITALEN